MEYAVIIPVITAVVQGLKMTFLPSRFAILVSLALGVGFSAFANTAFTYEVFINGLIVGLSSAGLYDGVKMGSEQVKKMM